MKEKGFTPNRHAADSAGIEQYLSQCTRSCSIGKPISRMTGFTLIELSIVLVIIGLIVGGVLVGQDLIKAAELRSVVSQKQAFETAANTFRLKYNCIAGDCNNATTFFGVAHATPTTCEVTASTGTETCNGDGDKNIEIDITGSREAHRFWQQLGAAGLIEGLYTGTPAGSGGGDRWDGAPGSDVPAGDITGSGWLVYSRADLAVYGGWYTSIFPPDGSNWFINGRNNPSGSLHMEHLTPSQAWSIDDKMDDGMPGTGRVTTWNNTSDPNCASSDTASSATYQLTVTTVACNLFFGF